VICQFDHEIASHLGLLQSWIIFFPQVDYFMIPIAGILAEENQYLRRCVSVGFYI